MVYAVVPEGGVTVGQHDVAMIVFRHAQYSPARVFTHHILDCAGLAIHADKEEGSMQVPQRTLHTLLTPSGESLGAGESSRILQ